jgi:hypothetical protein
MSRRYGQWMEDDLHDVDEDDEYGAMTTVLPAPSMTMGLSPHEWQSQLSEHMARAQHGNASLVRLFQLLIPTFLLFFFSIFILSSMQ